MVFMCDLLTPLFYCRCPPELELCHSAFLVCFSFFFPLHLGLPAASLRALLLFSPLPWRLQPLGFVSLRAPSRLLLVAGWFNLVSLVDLFLRGRLRVTALSGSFVVNWDLVLHLPPRSPALCFYPLNMRFPTDGTNIK
ncbi:hypothetical protein PIB30_081738, partial [Stylosanthes scabra]|nr:hypothetical protein [Stylosanthes scabra]